MPELKTVLPNADFVIAGYADPPSLRYGVTSPREPLRDEGPFGDHTGNYTLPEPYPVFHVTATMPHIVCGLKSPTQWLIYTLLVG